MTRQREVIEGVLYQGIAEEVIYSLDISEWGMNPTNINVVVTDQNGEDVTDTAMPGTPIAFSATIIKFPPLGSLEAGSEYKVEVVFETDDNQVLSAWFTVMAEE